MLKLPSFFRNLIHRKEVNDKLKMTRCPVCQQRNYLIRNGLLKGNDPQTLGNRPVERGQRLRCSNRGRRLGCGSSFFIALAHVLPRFSVDSIWLCVFLQAYRHEPCVHTAWLRSNRQFSLSTAYRLWKKLKLTQPRLREYLCRLVDPPDSTSECPQQGLIAHLFAAFTESDPIAAFQAHFQRPFWL